MTLEKEILKLRIALEKETNKDIRKILLEQKKYLEKFRKDVGSLYMKYGNDEGVIEITSVDKFNEMKKIEKEIVDMRGKLTKVTIGIVGASLVKSYVDSYYKTANIINKGVNVGVKKSNIIDKGIDISYKTVSTIKKSSNVSVGINYKLLRPEFVRAVVDAQFINQTYSSRIWSNHSKLANRLYQVIGDGITEGTSIQKLSKEIKDAFGVSGYEAQRLVQTEMARVVTNATEEIYRDSGVVDRVMYVATLDDRTSEICSSRDSIIWDLNDPNKPEIPAHPFCRSVWVGVVGGWQAKTRRDNVTKEEIPFTDYESWAKDN